MSTILRITHTARLKSADPFDSTPYSSDATHQYFYFSGYHVLEDGTWEEGRSWAGTVSVRKLFALLHDAELLREVTSPKQSGGEPNDAEHDHPHHHSGHRV